MSAVHPDDRSPYFGSPGREPVELSWQDTWPEDGPSDDYVAVDNGITIGRVMHAQRAAGLPGAWSWSGYWFERRPDGKDWGPRGICDSRREAMEALEQTYNAWRAVRVILPEDHPYVRGSPRTERRA